MHGNLIPHSSSGASPPVHDTAAAVAFIGQLVPSGRVALAAIEPDRRGAIGRTFTMPADRNAVAAWIEARQGRANLYFNLNEPRAAAEQVGYAGKLAEADVAAIRGVALDVDPRAEVETQPGGSNRERGRLDALVVELRGEMMGEPTAVVRSGAGIQALWLFDVPMLATPEVIERVKSQARGLERRFGSDPVHDVARILRLPGTVNLPDAKKRARGRVPCPASIISMTADRWSLGSLAVLAAPVARSTGEARTEGVDLSGAMGVLGDPEGLPAELRFRLAAQRERWPLLRRALEETREAPQGTRSDADFALAAACVEAGFTDFVDAACILAAYGSEKVAEREELYLASTVRHALAKTSPCKRPEEWFDEEAARPARAAEPAANEVESAIDWIDPCVWAGRALPVRQWEVEGWIPRGEVTLLYGDGGVGKTLLIHGYATCAAIGRPWLGQKVRPARVLCFFCEDSADELHIRQAAINRALGIDFTDLGNLRLTSRKGMDNLLVLWDRSTGAMKRQAVWDRLKADAVEFRADVVIIDTLADVYCGSEIDRAQVSAFVKSCLGRLAQETGGSVIALGHPSQSGKATGTGTSGSTAWSNAARSRLYLRYPQGTDRGNVRELEGMKSNYGPRGHVIKLRWDHGAFVAIAATTHSAETTAPVPGTEDAAETAAISALMLCPLERLSWARNSPFYAPRRLKALEPDVLAAFSEVEVMDALERLIIPAALSCAPCRPTRAG